MRIGKRKMEDNVIGVNNFLDEKIYRIFSIDRFKELITTKNLVLVNPSKWDDPFENFFLKATGIDESGNQVSFKNISDKWYGQCWTLTEESDAMWRIYSPMKDKDCPISGCPNKDKHGVRVSTTVRKLFSAIWDSKDDRAGLKYFIGKVSYHSRDEIEASMSKTSFWDIAAGGQNDNFAKLLCMKRPEFSHENEVRILVHDTDSKGKQGCYPINFDYNNIFEDVCLDPRLDNGKYDLVKDEINKLGWTLPIKQSELYRCDFPQIKLQ